MRFAPLLEPIDDAAPAGPDLDEVGDDDYLNFIFASEERLPSSFYIDDEPFDRRSVDVNAEAEQIAALLERSRDLRLVTLEARFRALQGNIVAFGECVNLCAELLERFWQSVHPGADGDMTLRQNTVEALDSRTTVVLPLQYATIVRDKRQGEIRLRPYALAQGDAEPVGEEKPGNAAAILDALASAGNAEAVEAAHGALTQSVADFARIRAAFVDNVGYDDAPSFEKVTAVCKEIVALIEAARPDLKSGDGTDAGAEPAEDEAAEDGADGSDEAAMPVAAAAAAAKPTGTVAVASHAAARNVLSAVEEYFARHEPTSPALVLVHQARKLIGKPLVVAMEALMPEMVNRANITLDKGLRLELDIGRLRSLTDDAARTFDDDEPQAVASAPVEEEGEAEGSGENAEGEDEAAGDEDAGNSEDARAEAPAPAPRMAGTDFRVADRVSATQSISAVESFYRESEPSSPVPLLLQKARGYMNRDFAAIVSDLMPRGDDDS